MNLFGEFMEKFLNDGSYLEELFFYFKSRREKEYLL